MKSIGKLDYNTTLHLLPDDYIVILMYTTMTNGTILRTVCKHNGGVYFMQCYFLMSASYSETTTAEACNDFLYDLHVLKVQAVT